MSQWSINGSSTLGWGALVGLRVGVGAGGNYQQPQLPTANMATDLGRER